MSVVATIATVLLSVVSAYALDYTTNMIEEAMVRNKDLTPSQISKFTESALNEAKAKGSRIYNEVASRLQKVNGLSRYTTGYVKDILSKAEANYQDKLNQVEQVVGQLDKDATRINSLASDYSMTSSNSKLNGAAQKYKTELNKINSHIKDVETKLNEVNNK